MDITKTEIQYQAECKITSVDLRLEKQNKLGLSFHYTRVLYLLKEVIINVLSTCIISYGNCQSTRPTAG